MATARSKRRVTALDGALAVVFVLLLAHFGWHAVQGEYGTLALIQIQADGQALEAELADLRAERDRLERLTAALTPRALDLDLLDERARAVLGDMRPDEVTPR